MNYVFYQNFVDISNNELVVAIWKIFFFRSFFKISRKLLQKSKCWGHISGVESRDLQLWSSKPIPKNQRKVVKIRFFWFFAQNFEFKFVFWEILQWNAYFSYWIWCKNPRSTISDMEVIFEKLLEMGENSKKLILC